MRRLRRINSGLSSRGRADSTAAFDRRLVLIPPGEAEADNESSRSYNQLQKIRQEAKRFDDRSSYLRAINGREVNGIFPSYHVVALLDSCSLDYSGTLT